MSVISECASVQVIICLCVFKEKLYKWERFVFVSQPVCPASPTGTNIQQGCPRCMSPVAAPSSVCAPVAAPAGLQSAACVSGSSAGSTRCAAGSTPHAAYLISHTKPLTENQSDWAR